MKHVWPPHEKKTCRIDLFSRKPDGSDPWTQRPEAADRGALRGSASDVNRRMQPLSARLLSTETPCPKSAGSGPALVMSGVDADGEGKTHALGGRGGLRYSEGNNKIVKMHLSSVQTSMRGPMRGPRASGEQGSVGRQDPG